MHFCHWNLCIFNLFSGRPVFLRFNMIIFVRIHFYAFVFYFKLRKNLLVRILLMNILCYRTFYKWYRRVCCIHTYITLRYLFFFTLTFKFWTPVYTFDLFLVQCTFNISDFTDYHKFAIVPRKCYIDKNNT